MVSGTMCSSEDQNFKTTTSEVYFIFRCPFCVSFFSPEQYNLGKSSSYADPLNVVPFHSQLKDFKYNLYSTTQS